MAFSARFVLKFSNIFAAVDVSVNILELEIVDEISVLEYVAELSGLDSSLLVLNELVTNLSTESLEVVKLKFFGFKVSVAENLSFVCVDDDETDLSKLSSTETDFVSTCVTDSVVMVLACVIFTFNFVESSCFVVF